MWFTMVEGDSGRYENSIWPDLGLLVVPASRLRVVSCPDNLSEPGRLPGRGRQVKVLPGRSCHCPVYLIIYPKRLFTTVLCIEQTQSFSEMTLQWLRRLALE